MKKYLYAIGILLFCFNVLSAQDFIIMKNGEVVKAKITRIDSSAIYFKLYFKGNLTETFISRNNIESYHSEKSSRLKKLHAMDPISSTLIYQEPEPEKTKVETQRNAMFVLSGELSFGFQQTSQDVESDKRTEFSYIPLFGVRVRNRHEFGGGLGYQYIKLIESDSREFMRDVTSKSNMWYFDFYYRWYFTSNDLKLYISPVLSSGQGVTEYDSDDVIKTRLDGFSFTLGATYRLSNRFELDLGLGLFKLNSYTFDYEFYGRRETENRIEINQFFETQSVSFGCRFLF